MDKQRKFYCYSIQLKNFLKLQGINYEFRGKHKKTNNWFWVFANSRELNIALEKWIRYKDYFKEGELDDPATD